jgi:hypothetical protein
MSANVPAEPKIKTPQQVFADRVSALSESGACYALFSLAHSPDPADRASLAKALDAAEQWQRELAAVRAQRKATQQ